MMLNLYAGRENIDKERFVYDRIMERGGETFVLVPDQYTLVAEEQALRYTGMDCLFDIEILSMDRLGMRLLAEQGRESVTMLDKYGRFMLLTRLIKEHIDDFDIFRRSAGKITFTSMLSDFISEFKQQECSLEQIEAMLRSDGIEADSAQTDSILPAKLSELKGIIEAYEKAIDGRYKDAEDYITTYVDVIRDSRLVRGKSIWIYGYDSITPKFSRAMIELAKVADSVNYIVNRSDFKLDGRMTGMLRRRAAEEGVECITREIGREYELSKSQTIRRIERELWADSAGGPPGDDENNPVAEGELTVVSAANPYYEAESAACYIWHLVRDLGYRMRDIQVIANDEAVMHPIIRRVFEEYELPVFMDASRDITDAAPVGFIVNLLWFTVYSKRSDYLFAMLKTGLSGISDADIEDLENYARTYHIRNTMWDRDFRYGEDRLGADKLSRLNELRRLISEKTGLLPVNQANNTAAAGTKQIIQADNTAAAGTDKGGSTGERGAGDNVSVVNAEAGSVTIAAFVKNFRRYLKDVWDLDEAVMRMAEEETELGLTDEAQWTVESYNRALQLLDQTADIMGETEFGLRDFTDIYVAGLTNAAALMIPSSADGLSVGTMIRTRPGPVRAVVVLGANEGVLPMQPSTEGLFSMDEKKYFREKGFALGALDDIRQDEENAAMYRMMSKPSERLYISFSLTDADGGEAIPSAVIDSLRTLFPELNEPGGILRDVIRAGWNDSSLTFRGSPAARRNGQAAGPHNAGDIISVPGVSMRHMTDHIKAGMKDRKDGLSRDGSDPQLQALLKWYRKYRGPELCRLLRAAADENIQKPLGKEVARELFGRNGLLKLSASALTGYFDCPFRFYIDRGLRPKEERDFASDPRSIGDAYHECLMMVAGRLLGDRELLRRISTDAGKTAPDPGSPAAPETEASPEPAADELERIVSEELDRIAGDYEGGLFISTGSEEFRMSRIREICTIAARAMAKQLASDSLVTAQFEESFARGAKLEPVTLEVDGVKVYVEGKIDRMDILSIGSGSRARIIDYKTGSDTLDIWKMRNGYKMQLMIYSISAENCGYEPAGIFYFNIKDPIEGLDGKSGSKAMELASRPDEEIYKLKGKYVDEPGVLDAMPEDVLAGGRDRGISRELYEEVRKDVLDSISRTAEGILSGRIDIRPLKMGGRLVCTYCSYKPICGRDREYALNRPREIPPEPKG